MIFVLLAGQIWVTIAPYCHWIFDTHDCEIIEFFGAEDSETEKEEEKEEKDKTFQNSLITKSKEGAFSKANIFYFGLYQSPYHPEIQSPPPEFLSV